MNQTIIINDDYAFDQKTQRWQCTAMLSGEKLSIIIESKVLANSLTQDIKFDWESTIEDWLEENEPEDSLVNITIL